jgi:hypothetical protein
MVFMPVLMTRPTKDEPSGIVGFSEELTLIVRKLGREIFSPIVNYEPPQRAFNFQTRKEHEPFMTAS